MALFTAIGTALGATGAAATATGVAVTAGAAGIGTAIYGMMQQPKGPDMPKSDIKAPEAPKMEDAQAKAKARADEQRRAAARSKSVKTNPLGIKDEAQVARKKLLGG